MRLRTSSFGVRAPVPESLLGLQLLTAVLSLTAGSLDVITYLGLGGLFTAHITGNLVILAAHVAGGGATQLAPMLSGPVFMLMLGLTRILAGGLEGIGYSSLGPLLLLQFLLLAAFLPRSCCRWEPKRRYGNHSCHIRRNARCPSDGRAKRSRAGISQGGPRHCGDDDKYRAIHLGYWYRAASSRSRRDCHGA